MSDRVRCMWMRGGTSKGGYFLADDLPSSEIARERFLIRAMGSPDIRQIDGMGGADPLTSKVAVVKKSDRPGVDVDYLFLQVFVDQPKVTEKQNCGNILAAVGPFAIERGLVQSKPDFTSVTIYMENTGQVASARVATPGGRVTYRGDAHIDGVPGTAAPIEIEFQNTIGSACGTLLPTGNALDVIAGMEVTMIDNGMPCVILRAEDIGISGKERPEVLEADRGLRSKLEAIRLKCGPLMNLGDVTEQSIPKMTMVSAAINGGAISTRTFIPHQCHKTIGVLGALSVATACLLKGSCAYDLAEKGEGLERNLSIEHPAGEMTVVVVCDENETVERASILRSARKLMDGSIFT